jgi:hypothetical protein
MPQHRPKPKAVRIIGNKAAFADRALERPDLSPRARELIERFRQDWLADNEALARRPGVCARLHCGPAAERWLEARGEIRAFDGGDGMLIETSSCYELLISRAIAAYPLEKLKTTKRKVPSKRNKPRLGRRPCAA